MVKVKSGRRTYEVKPGDYFLDNGACIQFVPRDNLKLPWYNYSQATSVLVSKVEWKRLLKEVKFKVSDSKRISYITFYSYQPKYRKKRATNE